MAAKILLIDDEPDFLTLWANQLGRHGWDVATAGSGMEALNKARTWHPDIILLDVGLPDLDGMAVCDILRQLPSTSDIPVIMVTALASAESRDQACRAGAEHYLSKPFSSRDLVDCLDRLWQQRLAEREAAQAAPEGAYPE